MSKGLGKREREILDALNDMPDWPRLSMVIPFIDPPNPIDSMLGWKPTHSNNYSSYKRAVRSLRAKGLIETRSNSKVCWLKRTHRTGPLRPWEKEGRGADEI